MEENGWMDQKTIKNMFKLNETLKACIKTQKLNVCQVVRQHFQTLTNVKNSYVYNFK